MSQVAIEVKAPGEGETDALAIPFAAGSSGSEFSSGARELDNRLEGRLQRLADSGELKGDLGATIVLHTDGEVDARRVVVAGVGKSDELDADGLRTAAAAVAHQVADLGGSLGWLLDESLPLPLEEQARAIVEGTMLGSYSPARWKTQEKPGRPVDTIVFYTQNGDGLVESATQIAGVGRWVDVARDLANSPPNELTPEVLATRSAELAGPQLQVESLDASRIDELGMGALSAVGRASANGPRLIVLRYEPAQATRKDLVLGLVGKAITFDAGGISLKPALKMQDMKGDMAGGAAVIAGIGAVAELELPVRIVAVVAAAENLVSGDSFRPGDILRAANGKTIEITNTDAEGRLVLADAMWYARREGATHLLDLATLTGAMELALGDFYAGAFANDDEWMAEILAAAKASGDHAWPFPLHPRYRRYVDSSFADLKNSSDLRQGSPVLAAEFLREFSGEGPWAHIDMAGPGFLERSRGDYLTQRGGTGYGVRLIVELAQRLSR
ncbi:MAG: leucyl aminopeptidase [Gaiellaceae bacterium]|jgi:leucyl aminopeptidase|nr:leucyl aminopeptidase [Gaiellaceae bacterium]